MPDQPKDRRPHLVLTNTSTAQAFTAPSPGGGGPSEVPAPHRAQHGTDLKAQLVALQPVAQRVVAAQQEQGLESAARGTSSKFHYRPLDATTDDFVARINAAAEREDNGDPTDPKDPDWVLGDRQRHRASLHKDIWRGTAAELANRGFIAVYPAKGWWRTRPAQERYDLPARYSLVVSIRTPATDVDLYTPIAQQVATQAVVPVVVYT